MKELKSIWHKPSKTPRNYSAIIEHHKANDYDNHTLIEQYDIWATGGSPVNPFDEYTIRWAYVEDFLTLETDLERTRKALDVAVGAIDEILVLDSGKFIQEPAEMWKIAKSAKDKITALEQKD